MRTGEETGYIGHIREGPGGASGLDPRDLERIEIEFTNKEEVDLIYNFPNKLKSLYNATAWPESLDTEIVNYINNKLWSNEEFTGTEKGDVQPWRENFFIFYGDSGDGTGIVNVMHGAPLFVTWDYQKLFENKTIYLIGHSHPGYVFQLAEVSKWTGLFLRNFYSEKLKKDIVVASCPGRPSEGDLAAGKFFQADVDLDPNLLNVVVGEQFITFYKSSVEAVYDIDTGKKVGTNIKYLDEALKPENKKELVEGIYEMDSFPAVKLENGDEYITYDIFGNKTGGTGGSQKELRKVSGGIKVSSQGYISLEY